MSTLPSSCLINAGSGLKKLRKNSNQGFQRLSIAKERDFSMAHIPSVVIGKDEKGYKVSVPGGDTYRARSLRDAEFLARAEAGRLKTVASYAPGVRPDES